MINARAETVATSPAFARSFAQRRCLVPADGWYEWVRSPGGKRKQAYFMTRSGGLALGGIWSTWRAGGNRLVTFSVITLPAEGHLARVHTRMPLVLSPDVWEAWLRTANPASLLVPAPSAFRDEIELRPVSAAVGDVRNDGPDLVRRVAEVSVAPSTESTMGGTGSFVEPTLF
jgi:putative SOS response-associated peptidase YedK